MSFPPRWAVTVRTAGQPSPQPGQEFLIPGRAEQGRWYHSAGFKPKDAGGLDYLLHRLLTDFGILDDAAFAYKLFAGFKLGFYQDHAFRFRRKDLCEGRNDKPERNEGAIDRKEIRRFGELFRSCAAYIGAFHNDDPRVLPYLPGHLPIPNVNGVDLCGAVLEQAVGEPAGRGAYVNRDTARGSAWESLECGFEFFPASTHKPAFLANIKNGCRGQAHPRFVESVALAVVDMSRSDKTLGFGPADLRLPLYERINALFF